MPNVNINRRVVLGGQVRYGAYTTAWYTQVLANGGSATPTELAALTVFETAVGSDMAEFDRLGIMGLQNSIAARTSFVNPTSTMLTLVNSPTFTAGLGFTGNGTTMYINANYNTSTGGVKFALNSNCMFIYSRTNSVSATVEIGATDASQKMFLGLNGGGYPNNMSNGTGSPAIAIADTRGLFVNRRTGATASEIIRNGVQLATSALSSLARVNNNNYLLGVNLNGTPTYSARQYSAYGFGSGAINQSTFYTALQTLATTLGFNV